MTEEAAIAAMKQGKKVSHRLFNNIEYIWWYMPEEELINKDKPLERRPDCYIDEFGCRIDIDTFWAYRKGIEWETGWEIVE